MTADSHATSANAASDEPIHVDGKENLEGVVTDAAVAKFDVDANQQLASDYGVRSVPTLGLFADGEQVEEVGIQFEERLRSLVESYAA